MILTIPALKAHPLLGAFVFGFGLALFLDEIAVNVTIAPRGV